MKRVFLISPSIQENVQNRDPDNSYGLGLGYLHSVIERAGYDIRTAEYNSLTNNLAEEMFVSTFSSFMPDYLLIQVFTMNRVACYEAIRTARKIKPDVKIIAGGVHASILYEQLLQSFPIDYIVIGEGERTIIELLDTLDSDADAAAVQGIAFIRDGNVIITPERPLIADLDSLPFPNHALFITPERKMACILTSRGCPFKCNFCCLHAISHRKYRRRSASNVVDEIEFIAATFPDIKIIQIADDTFTLDQQRAIQICEEIVQRRIDMKFYCSARFKPASRELFKAMERAGFISIGFGLETGSEKLMKSIHKNITQQDVLDTFDMLRDASFSVTTFMMVGFPGETDETVSETIRFIKRLQKIKYFEFAGVARLWVYPGTEVYEIMKSKGKIDDDFWLSDQDVPHYTVDHSPEKLTQMVTRISLSCMTKRQMVRRAFETFKDVNRIKEMAGKLGRFLKSSW